MKSVGGIYGANGRRVVTLRSNVDTVVAPRLPMHRGYETLGADSSGWNGGSGYTLIWRVRGGGLYNFANRFTISIRIKVATMIWVGFVVRRTLTSSITYLDSAVVTFGGNAAPSMGVGWNESDPISVTLDDNHDYYVLGYLNSTTGASAAFSRGSDPNCEVWAGFQTNDHRADATCGIALGGGNVYGSPIWTTVED